MAFTEYKNLASVLKEFSLPYREQLLEHDTALKAPAALQQGVFVSYQQSGDVYKLDALFSMLSAILLCCQKQLQVA